MKRYKVEIDDDKNTGVNFFLEVEAQNENQARDSVENVLAIIAKSTNYELIFCVGDVEAIS